MPRLKNEISQQRLAAQSRQVFSQSFLRNRELGLDLTLGHNDRLHKTLYTSMQPINSWDHSNGIARTEHGAVFNLEYSPDGSLLLAACERRSVLMFDPLSRKLIHSINEAHDDCVNNASFLDQRMFATCSDDGTVGLWDARNLKHRIRRLQGHSNWVKNVEYSSKDKLLLTSGFDGVIFTWDINSFTENSCLSTKVFQTNGLMRSRLTPDARKMLICTTSGYLIIIHDLNLNTLNQDLAGFKPNMYRLMQLSQTTIPTAASFTHLFSSSQSQNRVEFITDFPQGDDAEVISSLQIHPHSWCALSRNVSAGEKSEWTCIHDIQERFSNISLDIHKEVSDDESMESPSRFGDFSIETVGDNEPQQPSRSGITSSFVVDAADEMNVDTATPSSGAFSSSEAVQPNRPSRTNSWQEQQNQRRSNRSSNIVEMSEDRVRVSSFGVIFEVNDQDGMDYARRRIELDGRRDDGTDENLNRATNRRSGHQRRLSQNANETSSGSNRRRNSSVENRSLSSGNVELHVNSSDVWEALVAIREARIRRENERDFHLDVDRRDNSWARQNNNRVSVNLPRSSHTVVIVGDRPPQTQNRQGQPLTYAIPRNHRIHQNIRRLTHYIEEPNVGSGYIKELCFSADGRLICSPFGKGLRLLAFSNECQELSDCVPSSNESMELIEVASCYSHGDIVASTKFSPRHCLLVSGCLSGQIVWYQPVL